MTEPPLTRHVTAIIGRFETQAAVRDRAIAESRLIVRLAANTVRATHRRQHAEAEQILSEAHERLAVMLDEVREHPSLYWSGYVQDAVKEYAEARITAAIIKGEELPGPADVGAEDAAYLNALAEAASELRRQILDLLRRDEFDEAERLFQIMDEVYDQLVTVDFADAITGGLRRATDQLRGVLERTRGDLTLTVRQQRLEKVLREAEAQAAAAMSDSGAAESAPQA